jgi:hypothetical protein
MKKSYIVYFKDDQVFNGKKNNIGTQKNNRNDLYILNTENANKIFSMSATTNKSVVTMF